MPRNVEIKAKIDDIGAFKKLSATHCTEQCKVYHQHDTFFNVPNGRLKLRVQDDRNELIYYERSSTEGPKLCDYVKHNPEDHATLKEVLRQAYGIRGTVEKTRSLYMYGQTRIHADEVKSLGSYMELEVVLNEDQSIEEGNTIAHDLMEKLNIKSNDLLTDAYIDMLEKNKK